MAAGYRFFVQLQREGNLCSSLSQKLCVVVTVNLSTIDASIYYTCNRILELAMYADNYCLKVQPGVLQEKPGPSVATEFGVLLPEVGGSGVGASGTGIMSQRWDWGTVHFNIAANLTRDQHAEAFVDAIIEGPSKWKVRPVAEFYFGNVFNETQTFLRIFSHPVSPCALRRHLRYYEMRLWPGSPGWRAT